jgi:hypothetical protein
MKLSKKQIERAVEVNDAIDKGRKELKGRFDEKTAATITYHLIYPKGRGDTKLT